MGVSCSHVDSKTLLRSSLSEDTCENSRNEGQTLFLNYNYTTTECTRDRGPYEVKNACRETLTHASRVKYAGLETRTNAGRWAWALNFGELSGFEQYKEALINYRFNIFAYEGQDPWHTLYKQRSMSSTFFCASTFTPMLLAHCPESTE